MIERVQLQLAAEIMGDLNPNSPTPNEIDELSWNAASIPFLHRKVTSTAMTAAERQALRSHPTLRANLVPALKAVELALRARPFDSRLCLRQARLRSILGVDERLPQLISFATKWSPQSGSFHLLASSYAFAEGATALGTELLAESMRLYRKANPDHARLAAEFVSPMDFAAELPGDSARALFEQTTKPAIQQLPPTYRDALLQALTRRLTAMQLTDSTETGERDYYAGILYAQTGDTANAIAALDQAVTSQPANLTWRFRLATMLEQAGRHQEALAHAEHCLRKAPQEARYQRLVTRLHKAN